VKQRDATQFFPWISNRCELLRPSAHRLFHAAIENRVQDFFLALEIEIDGAVSDAGLASNVRDFGIEVAVVRKDSDRGTQDRAAFVSTAGRADGNERAVRMISRIAKLCFRKLN